MSGFTKPTTTQTPDALLDYWLTRLTGAELRVLLYAVRRTYGFGRDEDAIALEQFLHGITTDDGRVLDEGIGVSRRALLYAIKSLSEKGLLHKARQLDRDGRDTTSTYRLSLIDERHPQPRASLGLREVNTTQVPDEIFDHWLVRLSDSELKVLLYIVRRTLGFKKAADAIKPDQFMDGIQTAGGVRLDDGCGLSEKHLYRAISGLKEKGLITVERRVSPRIGHLPSVYTLVFESEQPALLRLSANPDPRMRDYRDTPEAERSSIQNRSTESTGVGVQKGRIEGAKRSGTSVQKRRIEGADRSGRGRNEDQKGYASKVASQQTDIFKDSQQTGNQQTDDFDIESTNHQENHDTSDQEHIGQRVREPVAEFGDTAPPQSSVTKAVRLWSTSGIEVSTMLSLIDDAAGLVRQIHPQKPMAYFFTTLASFVRTLPPVSVTPPADPVPIEETHVIWRAVLSEIRAVLTSENYDRWFRPTSIARHDEDQKVLVIATPDTFHQQWLDRRLRRHAEVALQRVAPGTSLTFVVDARPLEGEKERL